MVFSLLTELYNHHHCLNSRTFSSLQKEPLYLWAVTLPLLPSALGSHSSACLGGFTCCWHFTQMESYTVWSFVIGLFHVACYFQILLCCNLWHSFFLYFSAFHGHILFHYVGRPTFFIHSSADESWVVFLFCLLLIMLLWTFIFKFLWGHMVSVLLGIYIRMELLDHTVTLFNFRRDHQSSFRGSYTILYSCQQLLRVPVSPRSRCPLSVFLRILTVLMGVKWFLKIVLISLRLGIHAETFSCVGY